MKHTLPIIALTAKIKASGALTCCKFMLHDWRGRDPAFPALHSGLRSLYLSCTDKPVAHLGIVDCRSCGDKCSW